MIAILAFAWFILVSPWLRLYQIDTDEGLNLGKAALVAAGYGPYGEMWNDQGPVFTYLLAALQYVLPGSVHAARLTVAACSALMLAGLFLLIRRRDGVLAGLPAVLMLAATPFVIQLSTSIMIGLPAIGIAVTSLAVATARRPGAIRRMVISGLLFGLALQTKFFALAMAPALLVAVAGSAGGERDASAFRLGTIWAAAAVAGFVAVMLVSGQSPFDSVIATHTAPSLRAGYSLETSLRTIAAEMWKMPTVLLMGLAGLILLVATGKTRRALVPAVWLFVAFVALALHHPIFYHQLLLLVVPLAWLGGAGVGRFHELVGRDSGVQPKTALALAGGVALVPVAGGLIGLSMRQERPPDPARLGAEVIAAYAPLGGWVIADYPMGAFLNGVLVPPELVVFSGKRRNAGNLTDQDIAASVRTRLPTQVVFQRFAVPPAVAAALAADYVVAARGVSAQPYTQYVGRRPELGVDPAELRTRLGVLVDRMATTASGGGYAVTVNGADRLGESGASLPPDTIWMRPPGATYEVGERLWRAHAATGEARYGELALAAAVAVARSQTCRGGWLPMARPDAPCRTADDAGSQEDFDEGMTAGAISFLLMVADGMPGAPEASELVRSARNGLDFLVARQLESGAWPLAAGMPKDYRRLSTLGDDVTTAHIRILLDASRRFDEARYREAARRGLDFLLAAQLPSGAWAQYYDAALQASAGRPFEPAAAASIETAGVILTLLEAHRTLADPRLPAAARRASDWLVDAQIEPETWARFYETSANRPIYGDRDGSIHHRLEEISEERRTGYDWHGRFPKVLDAIRLARATADPASGYEAEREAMATADNIASAVGAVHPASRDPSAPLVTADWLREIDAVLAALDLSASR